MKGLFLTRQQVRPADITGFVFDARRKTRRLFFCYSFSKSLRNSSCDTSSRPRGPVPAKRIPAILPSVIHRRTVNADRLTYRATSSTV
jgi:hypothetical protein